jgi:hypothetical protein
MVRAQRTLEYGAAAVVAVLALAMSPSGVNLITGRPELSFRVNTVIVLIELFLVAVFGALLARGRVRQLFFHLIAWTLPFPALAGLEAGAMAINLANRIAPVEDNSLLANINRWPGYLMSDARWAPQTTGLRLYRPWRGDGIFINELGLRTASPTPKAAGEWRVALTGGSSAWGFRVLDADTIAARAQDDLRRSNPGITVYNFGIEGATLAGELALVKHFREVYAIDQVVFFTGGNNALSDYLTAQGSPAAFAWIAGDSRGFELLKVARRLSFTLKTPSSDLSAKIDDLVARTVANSSLQKDIAAVESYCDAVMLRCDFALQLLLQMRKVPMGPEVPLVRSLESFHPGLGVTTERIYRVALSSGASDRIHNLPAVVDRAAIPLFFDEIHMSERGNLLTAETIAAIIRHARPQ